jgi:hypothetical protein
MLRPDAAPVLAGKLDGRRAFARELELVPPTAEPTLVVLDFHGIDIATSSFLSEAVVHFRDHLRLSRFPTYLLVANLTERPLEELDYLLSRSGDALISCKLAPNGELTAPALLGSLDSKLKETFDLVKRKGETTAVELHGESADNDKIGATAWNNRLTALAAKSLVVEVAAGRTKKYRPLLEAA